MIPCLNGRPLPTFPCYRNKRPATENGFKDATTDPERIAALWGCRSGLLVAVPTGEASGIAVLDIDEAGLRWPGLAELQPTRSHVTRSGGRHLIFRHKPSLRCSQSAIAVGVDVRAEGGYVIWWPAHGYAASGDVLAEWPDWLVPQPQSGIHRSHSTRNGMGGFHTEGMACTHNFWNRASSVADRLRSTPSGCRGKTLNWAALVYGNMIAEGCMSWLQAEAWLIAACKENGLWQFDGERAVRREIERGLGYGIRVGAVCHDRDEDGVL